MTVALLLGMAMALVSELRLSGSAEAAGYSRSYGGYGGSIRHGRGRTQMRRTYHNRHPRRSKSRHSKSRYSGSGGGGYYRHGSVRQPTAFKSSDKYGPPRKYNPYRKRK